MLQKAKKPLFPCRRRCDYFPRPGDFYPGCCRSYSGSGCHNRYGTWRHLHKGPSVYRKSRYAWCLCRKYGSKRTVTFCSPSEPVSTTVSQVNFTSLLPHAQIVHIDIDTASISRNIHVDIPIVADAKEAITKMDEYVQECNTEKWLKQIAGMERRASSYHERPWYDGTSGYHR